MNSIDVIRLINDVIAMPILVLIWNIQGRLSRIEGSMIALKEKL